MRNFSQRLRVSTCTVSFQAKLKKVIAMDEEERAIYYAARDIPEDENDGYVTDNEMNINDVLDGTTRMDFSHAGGEFHHIIEEELHQKTSYVYSYLMICLFTFLTRTGVIVLIHDPVEIASISATKDSNDRWSALWMHTLPGKTILRRWAGWCPIASPPGLTSGNPPNSSCGCILYVLPSYLS
jgi:hypothetical protein